MNAALWAAKTGLDAQQTEMAVISNNLANVNTTGFKQDRAVFEDLLYQNQTQAGANTSQTTQSPSGIWIWKKPWPWIATSSGLPVWVRLPWL